MFLLKGCDRISVINASIGHIWSTPSPLIPSSYCLVLVSQVQTRLKGLLYISFHYLLLYGLII